MLAMKSYEMNEGFSVMTADELYFVNGGSACDINITMPSQSDIAMKVINDMLPSGVKVTDAGLSVPFGQKGSIVVSGGKNGISVGYRREF